MKRDWELVRAILTALEERQSTHGSLSHDAFKDDEGFKDVSPSEVAYHYYLLKDAGLIEATVMPTGNLGMVGMAKMLTGRGKSFCKKYAMKQRGTRSKEQQSPKVLILVLKLSR